MEPVADAVFPSDKKLSGWFSETAQKQPFSTSAWLEMHGSKAEIPARADYHFISSKGKRGEIPPGVKYAFSTNMFFDRQFPLGRGLFYQLQVPGRDYYGTSDPIDLDLLSLDSPTIPECDIAKSTNSIMDVDNELLDPDIVQIETFHNFSKSQSTFPMIDSISIFSSPPSPPQLDEEEIPTRMLLNASADTITSETPNSNPFYSLLSQQPLETLEDIFTTEDDISYVQNVEVVTTATLLSPQHSQSIEDVFVTAVSAPNLCLNEDQIIGDTVKSQTQLSDNIPSLPSQLPIESVENVINTTVSDADLNTSDVQDVEIVPIPTLLSLQPYESIEDVFVTTVSDPDLCLNEDQIIGKSQTQLSDNIPLLPSQLPIESVENVINTTVSDISLDTSDVQNVIRAPVSTQYLESLQDIFVNTPSDTELTHGDDSNIRDPVHSPRLTQLSSPEFFTPDIWLPCESGLPVIDEEQFSPVGEAENCSLQEESPFPPPPPSTETVTPNDIASPTRDEISLRLFHKTVSGDLETVLRCFSDNKLLFLHKFNQLPS